MTIQSSENQLSPNLLEKLARIRFETLTSAEVKLLRNAAAGDFAICGPNDDDNDPRNDTSKGEQWGIERQIHAHVIRWLCVDPQARRLIDPKGLRAYGAKVPDTLDLSDVAVPFDLSFQRSYFAQPIDLSSAELHRLDLQKSWVTSIIADGAQFKGDVQLRNGFYANSGLSFVGAHIGGDLTCSGCTVLNAPIQRTDPSAAALLADHISVAGNVFLFNGFRAEGQIRMRGAAIGGDLNCDGGAFSNPTKQGNAASGVAIDASNAIIKGKVSLSSLQPQEFQAVGTVFLIRAQVGGDLLCVGGSFSNPPDKPTKDIVVALAADGIIVEGDVKFTGRLNVAGAITLTGARISGQLACDGSRFHGAVILETAVIKKEFFWRNIVRPEDAVLDLANTTVLAIEDDKKSWPAYGHVLFDGFSYQSISQSVSDGPVTPNSRLSWIALQKQFTPQPYRQLANFFNEAGDADGAKEILVEMERRQRAGQWFRSPLLRWSTGYGYYPLRSFWALMAVSGIGWVILRRAKLEMTPTDENAYRVYKEKCTPPPHYPRFSPAIYSLENSLPLVKLGQTDRWQPDPNSDNKTTPDHNRGIQRLARFLASPVFLRRFLWIQILLGWILATLFAAGVTGLIHNQ